MSIELSVNKAACCPPLTQNPLLHSNFTVLYSNDYHTKYTVSVLIELMGKRVFFYQNEKIDATWIGAKKFNLS